MAVIFGNEVDGVLEETLKMVDDVVYIYMPYYYKLTAPDTSNVEFAIANRAFNILTLVLSSIGTGRLLYHPGTGVLLRHPISGALLYDATSG